VALLCLLPAEFLHAQQDEYAVRAAYVFNLTKYVTWPRKRDRLVVGVFGDGSTGPILREVLDRKMSDGKTIYVVLHPSESELRDCDILYVTKPSPTELHSILKRAAGQPVLTVGETDAFARAGGMVGLVRSGDQMQIQVNLESLKAAQLQMSSRLLRLAVIVSEGPASR
jgi:hypothetical protein